MHWGTVNESDLTAAVAIDSSKAAGDEARKWEGTAKGKEKDGGRKEGQRQKRSGKKS